MSGVQGAWAVGCGHSTNPPLPCRLLWYPGNSHALAGVEAEADGFMNIALWLSKHLRC